MTLLESHKLLSHATVSLHRLALLSLIFLARKNEIGNEECRTVYNLATQLVNDQIDQASRTRGKWKHVSSDDDQI